MEVADLRPISIFDGLTDGQLAELIAGGTEVAVVPGVETVDVQLAAKTVRVTGSASEDAVRAAVAEAGYEAA